MSLTTEQILARLSGIGGSDAAAILGVSPWAGALDVYQEKLGLVEKEWTPEEEDRLALGNLMERAIARRWAERKGVEIEHPCDDGTTLRHPDRPWQIAHIDGRIKGKPEGVEVKLLLTWRQQARLGEPGTDRGLPEHIAQAAHYLSVTEWERWWLVYYHPFRGLLEFPIERNRVLEAKLIAKEAAFWERVRRQDPPSYLESREPLEALAAMFPNHVDGKTISEPGPDLLNAIEDLRMARVVRDDADRQCKRHEAAIKNLMGDAEAIDYSGVRITWRKRKDGVRVFKPMFLDKEEAA
jgi:putative phage-type endonuclease